MKIRWHGMSGTQHSWVITGWSLMRAILKISDHELFVKSTNSLEHFPNDLKHLLLPGYHAPLSQGPADYIDEFGNQLKIDPKSPLPEIKDTNLPYDLEFTYTILFQGPRRFYPSSKARAIIWNFETSILPKGWQEYHRALDYLLPSSQFSYDIFANNGIPKDKMVIIPHGVDTNLFYPKIPPFKLKTEKKVKFLHNAIPHHRKFHDRMIKAYLDAFTGDDDVCLVMKTKFLTPEKSKPFEVNMKDVLEKAYKKRKNPPEIEIVNEYVPDIGALYTACDAIVSMSATEGFCLPLLEALACDKLVIAPRHGGQLEFLNDNNSLLIDTKEMYAPKNCQYWTYEEKAVMGDPSTKHCSELLRKVYDNIEKETQRILKPAKETVKKFSWENAAQMVLDLPIPQKSARLIEAEKRKVLYIVPYTIVGGAEVWLKQVITQLNGYEPHIAFVNGYTDEAKKLFGDLNATIEDLADKGRQHALKCIIESGTYSIVHFYNSFGIYQILRNAWAQGLRTRIVETVHSELSWSDSMTKVSARDKMVSMIISVSETLGKKLLQRGNKNVAILPQQIDWDRFKVERSKDILDKFDIPKDFVIGFVGRLSPEKNIQTILQCARSMPESSFVIIGDGPQKRILQQTATKNVFFLGNKQNVEEFYPSFDTLMITSSMEGLPLVALEAMVSGTPIVTSEVGAITEVVKDGINGFVSKKYNEYLIFITLLNKLKDKKIWQECSNNSKIIAKSLEERSKSFNINSLYKLLFKR